MDVNATVDGDRIKQVLTNWRGAATRSIGDRDFLAVQGSGPRDFLATLYFDPETGLLTRLVRYGPSPIGRMPTQIDYGDYRDVGGIKFPFEYKFTWMDGRYTGKLNEVKVNVAVEPATKCRLVIEYKGEHYIGALLFDDVAFCRQITALLRQNIDHLIQDIGDLDVSQTL